MRQSTASPPGFGAAEPPPGAVVVGGAVRDAHLGLPARDVDWLVADPAGAARALAAATGASLVELDAARGHWRVVLSADRTGAGSAPDAARRTWDFAAPDPPGDPADPAVLRADLLRRDLTINALAYRPESGEVVDPTGGLADLRRRQVRAVARGNLWADPLRGWRAIRIAAQLGFRVERRTQGWLRELSADLATGRLGGPAGERVGAELDAVLATPVAGRALAALDEVGLLALDLPELTAGRGVAQGGLHHLDVLQHQLEALQRLVDAFPAADTALH